MSAEYVSSGVERQACGRRGRSGRRWAGFPGRSFTRGPLWRETPRSLAELAPGDELPPETGLWDHSSRHNGLPMKLLPSGRSVWHPWFVPDATNDGQVRVAREARVGGGSLAEAERGTATGLDDPRVAACAAQPGRRVGHGVAERVGFEPTKSFDSALFKSAAINHSATSPPERIPAGRKPRGERCRGLPVHAATSKGAQRASWGTDVASESAMPPVGAVH